MASHSPHSVVEYGWRRVLITIAVMCAALLETLDSTIVNVALPTIEGNIGASIDEGIWIITGYVLANVIAIPLNPFFIRMFGRKRYFATCIIGFTLASVLCSTSTALAPLVAFRMLQGLFGGGLIATSQVIMRETFPPEQLGASSGLFAMAIILGPAAGPLAGGFLTDNASWKWIFDVNLLPGMFAAITIIALLRDPVGPERIRVDWAGVGLLTLGLGSLQYFLDNGESHDWLHDPTIAFSAVTAIIGIISFFCWELFFAREPVVDLQVFRMRSVAVGTMLAFAFGVIIFVPAIILPLYTSSILGYSAMQGGQLLVMRALPVILLTPVFAILAQNGADVRYFLVSGFFITMASLGALTYSLTAGTPFGVLAIPMLCSGVGQSMLLVPLIVGVLSTTPAELNGKVAPLLTLCVQLGGTISTAASISFFDHRAAFHQNSLRGAITTARLDHIGHFSSLELIARSVFNKLRQ